MAVKRTERGYAGHFVGARGCRFRRNTLLERGDLRIVVSTVGNYWLPEGAAKLLRKEDGPQEIGWNRYYETMAFHAMWEAPYWEADVSRQVEFGSEWAIDRIEQETDAEADAMHEAVVAEIAARMESGLA